MKPSSVFRPVFPILPVLCAVLCAITCAGPPESPVTKVPAERIDAVFAEYDRSDSPGCALAVIRDGAIVYERGYGMADLEHNIPITPETVFYIGSESKQFAAMCMLLLEEYGRLSLDDDVRKYIPELPYYGRAMTIRHLILHTSGLRDYFTLWALSGIDYANFNSEEETLALITRQKGLNFLPGEDRLYSNSGYLLLSVIVKRVTGLSLREFADERIFRPLGMTQSRFLDDPGTIIPGRAYGHMKRAGDGGWDMLPFRFALTGSGGLYTTVRDLAKWDANFYDNRLGGGQALIDRMLTPGALDNGERLTYACALTVGEYRGLGTVRHGGALGGYRSHILRFPDERFTVIALFNLGNVNPGDYAEKVADICIEDRLAPLSAETAPPFEATSAKVISVPVPRPSEYAGVFASEELMVRYRIVSGEEGLFVRIRDTATHPMMPMERDVFNAGVAIMRFTRDSRGVVNGFRLDAGRVVGLAFEKM